MSSRLTLLFCCEQHELYSLLASSLESADFQLVRASSKEEARAVLAERVVDAILICPTSPVPGKSLCAALKRRAPRTPILLLRTGHVRSEPFPGLYSTLHADAQDEVLTRAVAVFLREILTISGARRMSLHAPDPSIRAYKPASQSAI